MQNLYDQVFQCHNSALEWKPANEILDIYQQMGFSLYFT